MCVMVHNPQRQGLGAKLFTLLSRHQAFISFGGFKMRLRLFHVLALGIIVAAVPSFAGKFNGWSGPCKIEIKVPEPPVAYLGKKSAKVIVSSTVAGIQPDQVRILIEHALAPDILATGSSPEALFKISLVSFEEPQTKQYTLSESFTVKVGDRPVYNKDGTQKTFLGSPVTEPVYQTRVLPVQY